MVVRYFVGPDNNKVMKFLGTIILQPQNNACIVWPCTYSIRLLLPFNSIILNATLIVRYVPFDMDVLYYQEGSETPRLVMHSLPSNLMAHLLDMSAVSQGCAGSTVCDIPYALEFLSCTNDASCLCCHPGHAMAAWFIFL